MKIHSSQADGERLDEAHFIREKLSQDTGPLNQYMDLVIGERSFLRLMKYELITLLFGPIPGALGIVLRKLFYPLLFAEIGKGATFGRNITIRNAKNMRVGDNVIFDDDCLVDARGAEPGEFVIADNVLIGRAAQVHSKLGSLHVGKGVSIGSGSVLTSQGGITIGDNVAIGGGCKLSGGLFKVDENMGSLVRYSNGPVSIEPDSTLGMGCYVTDGVTVGAGAVVGTGVVVSIDVPALARVSARPPLIMKHKPGKDQPESD